MMKSAESSHSGKRSRLCDKLVEVTRWSIAFQNRLGIVFAFFNFAMHFLLFVVNAMHILVARKSSFNKTDPGSCPVFWPLPHSST